MLLASAPAFGEMSKLWGAAGEAWTPTSRLPDYSHAGYHAGEAPLPEVPVVANVTDFGAVGDGVTDDTDAFAAAIAAAKNGAVLIPAGRYVITDVLRISKSNVVLRGESSGPDGTVLFITKSLADVYGPDPEWSWSGAFIDIRPAQEVIATTATAVMTAASRGDTSLTVASTAGLAEGQLVELHQVDDGSGSLGRHLHNDQAEAGDCSYMVPLNLHSPVRIRSINGGVVTLTQPLRTDVSLTWSPELQTHEVVEEVGVEHLRIEFIQVPYAGHLKEPGYNAITFFAVADSWVRDVTIVDADSGIFTGPYVKGLTFQDIALQGRQGHHGIALSYSADVLVRNFNIANTWMHSLTVSARASGNVFSRGTSAELLVLDHHGDSPFENLFTQLSAYTFVGSGGEECTGPHGGARNTYWNLAAPMDVPLLWGHVQSNVVGEGLIVSDALTEDAQWYETVSALGPANLYEAQTSRRFCQDVSNACNLGVYEPEAASCSQSPRPRGTACDDGDPDTDGDACSEGVCAGTSSSGCSYGPAAPWRGSSPLVLSLLLAISAAAASRRRGPLRSTRGIPVSA
ncbi:glycosyl hydrolase family 28-related protein [Sorangium sp. So ce291]|uniref:glycosyl hydrolase family 28-related protein n=1 Tax=Sorangium sp. So ce291 TaxID=3133294 RepID=UPI003F5E3E16